MPYNFETFAEPVLKKIARSFYKLTILAKLFQQNERFHTYHVNGNDKSSSDKTYLWEADRQHEINVQTIRLSSCFLFACFFPKEKER